MTDTSGLIPVADLPCLMDRSDERVQRWIDNDVLPVVNVDGVTYARRVDVEHLRHPVRACAAEIDALLAAGRPIMTAEALDLVVRVMSDAWRADRS
jgi:hypothetical protein